MSDAKPYTTAELERVRDGHSSMVMVNIFARCLATVRALDAAQAEVANLRAELENERAVASSLRLEFGVSRVLERCKPHDSATLYVRTDGQQRRVSCVECLDAESAALKARVAELEETIRRDHPAGFQAVQEAWAERDEWKAKAEALMGKAG